MNVTSNSKKFKKVQEIPKKLKKFSGIPKLMHPI
jgi:hypothetical protein